MTRELQATQDMNEYELAGRIIEMAHKAFPIIYNPIYDFCRLQEDVKIVGSVKDDISRIV